MTTTSSTSDTTTGQPVVSIASNSSADAAGGSVIDVSSLVSQLVAATAAPQQALISTQTQAVSTQISALGTLKSALATFQSSLSSLDTPTAFQVQTANSTDQTAFTATADSGAAAGTYNVTVSALAQAQQLLSNAFAGGTAATVGTGTLSLSLGTTSFDVTIDGSDNTLAGIAAAINSAAGNPGIAATVLQGTDGAHLVLSSSLSGAANTIQVTETDGGDGLAALTYGTGNAANYTQEAAPQDAAFSIAGVDYTSPSNTVTDALNGVTLNLLGTTSAGSNATLSVSNDTSTIASNISAFVTAYNTMVTAIAPLGSYDASTNTAGPMLGNALLSGTTNQIQQALYSVVNTGSSTYNSLASIGITTNSDGSLSVNNATLTNALSTNFGAVSQLFSGAAGVATVLNSQITANLGSTGDFASASNTLVQQENALTTQTNQLNDQMTALTASLTQQYSALNVLLSSLQTTSAYLSQQFASLPLVQGVPQA
ncbi:MAG TPA: flagellar filament capping protein FliD [Steroidobacteraceae bacterium]|jgi:flagellar hook-associated protein 2|nr:flagellar filament capping protein FliD [Steroidobacteraceae bacterium]